MIDYQGKVKGSEDESINFTSEEGSVKITYTNNIIRVPDDIKSTDPIKVLYLIDKQVPQTNKKNKKVKSDTPEQLKIEEMRL